jgi:hypothetical protein
LLTVHSRASSIQPTRGRTTKFSRSGIKFFGVIVTARFECGEPAPEASELVWRRPCNYFGDFFDFHLRNTTPLKT